MSFLVMLEIIKGVLAFPDAILKVIKILQKTDAQRHEEIVEKISKEAEHFRDTGRPSA
ncbi:MAG: hypothetical protein KBD78_15835 [Oligoflexales bacterium]|nr:hypothetical protein [Oligoflexales bacterium]